MHPQLDPREYGKAGGKRPGAGRPKGTTTAVMAAKRAEARASIRFIPQKRERELWEKAIAIALKNRNVNALIKILITLAEFHYGKPYEAVNPNAGLPKPNSDPRLLMAIQNLQIVSQSPAQTSNTQVSETKALPETSQACHESSSKCDAIEAEQNVPSQAESEVEDER